MAVSSIGCGKKGFPIPPMTRIPGPVETISATRVGNDVYVTLTVPGTNIDKSAPIDISRIEVFGYTGRIAPTKLTWADLGTLVASIPVVAPPADQKTLPPPPPAGTVLDFSKGALPGLPVTVLDTLTADEFVQGRVDPRRVLPVAPPTATPTPLVLKRYYLAIPFSSRGRPGPPGAETEMVITALPDPPDGLRATYTASNIGLSWNPSGGLLGFLLDRGMTAEPVPFIAAASQAPAAATPAPDTGVPPGPTTYHVYRDVAPDPLLLPPIQMPPWSRPLPVPMQPEPGAATSLADTVTFGREQCYVVRARRGTVMSEPSERACIRPIDIFPPAAPTGLAAVPSEGGISLIWEPSVELDLGGYLVLRREPGDATLRLLTAAPVVEARFRDTDVQPGRRYIYSVAAIDSQLPLPNVSVESERVEETAR